jgi:gliding motility-associated-like protein
VRSLISLAILLLSAFNASAQDLCQDPRGYVKGGFDMSEIVCHNENIRITNTANVEDARYFYNYQGESFDEAYAMGQPSLDFSRVEKSAVYTVLQVGKINGKDAVDCKKIRVRFANVPVYSYTVCPGAKMMLNIAIPEHELNDFTNYEIKIDDKTVNAPGGQAYRNSFEMTKSPTVIHVTGSGSTKTCPSSSTPVEIQNFHKDIKYDNYTAISSLTLLDEKQVRIDFKGQYNMEHTLYKYPAGSNADLATPVQADLLPGAPYVDQIALPDRSYCYYLKANRANCSFISFRSADFCTIPLKEQPTQDLAMNAVTWVKYPGPTEYRRLQESLAQPYHLTIQRVEDAEVVFTTKGEITDFLHEDRDVECSKRYCYRVIVNHRGYINGVNFDGNSYSNSVCLDHRLEDLKAPLGAYVSTEDMKNTVHFSQPQQVVFPPLTWELYREDGATFVPVATREGGANLADTLARLTKSETYKLRYVDACENESEYSGPMKSIYLSEDGDNTLDWTKGNPYDAEDIVHFEVIYRDGNTTLDTKREGPQTYSHVVTSTEFVNEGTFIIRATSSSGATSLSNPLTISVNGALFLPSAFTPNLDGSNEYFYAKGSISSIASFQMDIYSTSGQKIAEVLDPSERSGWDGRMPDGKLAQTGTYLYRIKAEMKSGKVLTKNGSFILIR